jgi:hypothetical protein
MKILGALSIALLVGCLLCISTPYASTQFPEWARAAAQCRAQVRAQYPTAQESEGVRSARARAYQACLAGLGYRP